MGEFSDVGLLLIFPIKMNMVKWKNFKSLMFSSGECIWNLRISFKFRTLKIEVSQKFSSNFQCSPSENLHGIYEFNLNFGH